MTKDEAQKRVSDLWQEIKANEEENMMMEAEIEALTEAFGLDD